MIICRGMNRDEMKRNQGKILTYLLWFSPSQEYFVILFSGSPYEPNFYALRSHAAALASCPFFRKGPLPQTCLLLSLRLAWLYFFPASLYRFPLLWFDTRGCEATLPGKLSTSTYLYLYLPSPLPFFLLLRQWNCACIVLIISSWLCSVLLLSNIPNINQYYLACST